MYVILGTVFRGQIIQKAAASNNEESQMIVEIRLQFH